MTSVPVCSRPTPMPRSAGRVGLVDATLGPGATNLVTGLVEALNAGTPMVALVGDTIATHSWKNMTQESRQMDILRPACKEVISVEAIQRIPELMRRAFAVATTGRPGPVVVDVPEDMCHGTFGFTDEDFDVNPAHGAAPALRCRPDARDLAARRALIAQAQASDRSGGRRRASQRRRRRADRFRARA